MKVIEVTKTFTNGEVSKLIYIPDYFDIDEVDPEGDNPWEYDFAYTWVKNEGSGEKYGYEWDWKVVTDKNKINKCIKEEIEKTKDTIIKNIKYLGELKRNNNIKTN